MFSAKNSMGKGGSCIQQGNRGRKAVNEHMDLRVLTECGDIFHRAAES